MKYSVELNIINVLKRGDMFNHFNLLRDWCDENMSGEYQGGTVNLRDHNMIFVFVLESDALAFKLRWM